MTVSGYQLTAAGDPGQPSALPLLENVDNWAGTHGFRIDTTGPGASSGNAEPASAVVESAIRFGTLTRTTEIGNRVAVFDHILTGRTHYAIDLAEKLLLSTVMNQAIPLKWTKPSPGLTDVLDVIRATQVEVYDDLALVKRKQRIIRISYECAPFVRSDVQETIAYSGPSTHMGANVTILGTNSAPFVADNYLRFDTSTGVSLSGQTLIINNGAEVIPVTQFFTDPTMNKTFIPTHRWAGQSIVARFSTNPVSVGGTGVARILGYPARAGTATTPTGIGILKPKGTAPAPFTLTFNGGNTVAWAYTAPDPDIDLRNGVGETNYTYTVTVDPPDNYALSAPFGAPRAPEANPNGIWPQYVFTGAPNSLAMWPYPTNLEAAVTLWKNAANGANAAVLVSPRTTLPAGFHGVGSGRAIAHAPQGHLLWPGRCGFALLTAAGVPIPCTITYYPRWWNHVGE